MKGKILIIGIVMMGLLPMQGFAAIQFDFMDEPWALREDSREKLIEKLKEIDFDKIEGSLRKAGESLPDEVKNLPGKASDKLAEEGIDAKGIFGGIWEIFSKLGKWMFSALTQLFT